MYTPEPHTHATHTVAHSTHTHTTQREEEGGHTHNSDALDWVERAEELKLILVQTNKNFLKWNTEGSSH